MEKRLNNFLDKKGAGKRALILFVLTNLVYAFMLLVSIPETMKYSNGMKLLDMMPLGYDLNYVNDLFQALGATGRKTYLIKQLPADMIYPILFGLTYCLIMAYLLKKLNWLKKPIIFLCFLPVIAAIADYFENIGIAYLLISYPDISTLSVYITNIFSMCKSVSTSIYFVVLLLLLISLGYQALNRRKTNP